MNKIKKIFFIIITLFFLLFGNIFAQSFEKGKCSKDLILHQNLKAPKVGEKYIRNGRYHWYTGGIVKEAKILQKHLNRLGFNAGPIDGIIGPKTKGAILRLQKYLGTKQDGYVGPKTRALLNNSCGVKEKINEKEKKSETKSEKEKKEKKEESKKSAGKKIIEIAHKMAVVDKVIVRGSCWDFLDKVYDKAGYPRTKRLTIFKSQKKGPYVNIDKIKAGDWLYFINHSYHNYEHSGLFIEWVDKKKKIAKVLSYAGQNKNSPGRYRNYDLKSVYNIIRGE